MQNIITITTAALSQLKVALQNEKDAKTGIRVGLAGGGCSGMKWVLDVEDTPNESDLVQEVDGVKIYIDPMSALYMPGTTLDYLSTLQSSGFSFKNDKVSRTCGCNQSVAF